MTRASIRLRSAAALSAIVTLIWLGTALVTARLLTSELNEVFDSALQETGQRILQLAVVDVLERDEEGVTRHVMALDDHDEHFTYIVRDDRGRVLLTSHRADPARFPAFAETGFHQTEDRRFYHETAVRGTIALTIAEIDEALALLNQQEKVLAKMPRDFIRDQTNTELIAISMDELGISREAA